MKNNFDMILIFFKLKKQQHNNESHLAVVGYNRIAKVAKLISRGIASQYK